MTTTVDEELMSGRANWLYAENNLLNSCSSSDSGRLEGLLSKPSTEHNIRAISCILFTYLLTDVGVA